MLGEKGGHVPVPRVRRLGLRRSEAPPKRTLSLGPSSASASALHLISFHWTRIDLTTKLFHLTEQTEQHLRMSGAPPPYQPFGQAPQQQQQYAPPPGPPPGMAARPPQSTGSTFSGASAGGGGVYPPVGSQQQQQPPPPSNNPYASNNPFASSATSASAAPAIPARNYSTSGGAADVAAGLSRAGSSSATREDPLDLLKTFDTIVVVDDSGSMDLTPDGRPDAPSRWEEARDALAGVVHLAAAKDADGIDVHFLNSERYLEGCTDPAQVRELFAAVRPQGPTPLGMKLEMLLLAYLDEIETYKENKARGGAAAAASSGKLEPKKRNYIIITDGAPSDDVEDVVISIARRLDQGRFPLSQIGFVSAGSARVWSFIEIRS